MALSSEFQVVEDLRKRPLFTFGAENSDVTIVNEGVAITGFTQVQAYGLGGHENDMGFEVTRSMKNESGADRVVDWTITNETKATTLASGSITLSDGELSTATGFYGIDQISNGDFIRFTIGDDGIGTAVASPTMAQMSFTVKSIFLTRDD